MVAVAESLVVSTHRFKQTACSLPLLAEPWRAESHPDGRPACVRLLAWHGFAPWQDRLRAATDTDRTDVLAVGKSARVQAYASPPSAPIIDSPETICNYGLQPHRHSDCTQPTTDLEVRAGSECRLGCDYTLRVVGSAPRWIFLVLLVLALVLVPFALLEARILNVVLDFLNSSPGRMVAASAISLALASDVVLPVPSSLLATASGMLLGLSMGSIVTWTGMQAGALVGYYIGSSVGTRAVARFVGSDELKRAAESHRRWGGLSLIATRAVPVLAESSVVFAGALRMPMPRFLFLTGASNAAVASVYAFVGAYALEAQAFLVAFAASVIVPGGAMLLHRFLTRRIHEN